MPHAPLDLCRTGLLTSIGGGFKRVADLRRVKGFGYKTFKRLEPFLDITGETTLAVRR